MGVIPLSIDDNKENTPTFFIYIMTNESGKHSYLYEMKLYETINSIRTPIAIGFNSYINDTHSFKALLNEIYLIIISDLSLHDKKIEVINYLMFIHSIKVPPMHSMLSLNLRFSSIDYYFPSQTEIPTVVNDHNINVLFSVLELSKIIKLWLNLLYETRIILYGDNVFLFHAIIDAITKLIFPFTYSCTIISCLPLTKIDILDLPCPYIIGVKSSTVSLEFLRRKYSHNCIVDLLSGRVYSMKINHLPKDEEMRIQKEIQFIRNPELFNSTEVFQYEKKRIIDSGDIDLNDNFSTNVKRIFFRLMKQILSEYDSYINKENKEKFYFNSFLATIQNEDMRSIWEKIIKTNTFFMFYTVGKYFDDYNNTRIFNRIISEEKNKEKEKCEKKSIHNCFYLEISLNKPNTNRNQQIIKDRSINDNDRSNSMIIESSNLKLSNISSNNQQIDNQPLKSEFKFYSNDGFIVFLNSHFNQCSLIGKKIEDVFIEKNYIMDLHMQYKNKMTNHHTLIINSSKPTLQSNNSDDDLSLNQKVKNNNESAILMNIKHPKCLSGLYLFLAFNLPQNQFSEDILNYYHEAHKLDEDNFFYYRYYSFVQKQNYSLNQLEQIAKKIEGLKLKMIIDEFIKSKRHIPIKMKLTPCEKDNGLNATKNKSNKSHIINDFTNYDQVKPKLDSSNNRNTFDISVLEKISEQMKKDMTDKKSTKKICHNVIKESILVNNNNESHEITAFTCRQILNIQKKVSKISNASELMNKISQKLFELINKSEYSLNIIYSEQNNDLLKEIKHSVNKLQKINLTKLATINDKYVFWLNAFNFLLMYSIIITQFKPRTFDDWRNLLINSLYKIGGYDISLYEIENLILNGHNIYQETIVFTDPFMKKFSLTEFNILIDCVLYFPIKNKNTSLVLFNNENYLKQIEDNTNEFFVKNIKYDSDNKRLTITNYLLLLFPHFESDQYKQFKDHIGYSLYKVIKEKEYDEVICEQINWETLFN